MASQSLCLLGCCYVLTSLQQPTKVDGSVHRHFRLDIAFSLSWSVSQLHLCSLLFLSPVGYDWKLKMSGRHTSGCSICVHTATAFHFQGQADLVSCHLTTSCPYQTGRTGTFEVDEQLVSLTQVQRDSIRSPTGSFGKDLSVLRRYSCIWRGGALDSVDVLPVSHTAVLRGDSPWLTEIHLHEIDLGIPLARRRCSLA